MEEHDARTTIIRKSSKDGELWSEREIIQVDSQKSIVDRQEIISPAIEWTGEKWRIYYVDDVYTNQERGIQMAESEDGVYFENKGSVWVPQEVKPWHIDVQLIDGTYYLLVHDVDNRTLNLYDSKDGLTWNNWKELLKASKKITDYWSQQLYRACLVKTDNKLRIYFSATDGMASYIGLMVQNEQGEYEIIDCYSGSEKAAFVIRFWWRRCVQFVNRVIHFIKKRI